ncbi:MAG: serine/threonine protein kinase [Longimicrobiaceae bacterium]
MRYLLYGLEVESDAALPALAPHEGGGEPEVRVTVGAHPEGAARARGWVRRYLSDRANADDEPTVTVDSTADGRWVRLRYADGTEFTVDAAGTRIGCTWHAPMTLEDAATYLLGPVFGMVLRLRGLTCLHASAVAVDGRALLVCGAAGAGKSTTAAAFAARGRAVLADDVAALERGPGGFQVRGGYPHLRLWPDAVRGLYGDPAALPLLTPNWEKRFLDLGGGAARFEPGPLPLAAVYLLGPREAEGAPRLEPVAATQAVLALIGHTYVGWVPDRAAQVRDLALYGQLAREVPVLRALPHADPARLPELCALLEADVRARGTAA